MITRTIILYSCSCNHSDQILEQLQEWSFYTVDPNNRVLRHSTMGDPWRKTSVYFQHGSFWKCETGFSHSWRTEFVAFQLLQVVTFNTMMYIGCFGGSRFPPFNLLFLKSNRFYSWRPLPTKLAAPLLENLDTPLMWPRFNALLKWKVSWIKWVIQDDT